MADFARDIYETLRDNPTSGIILLFIVIVWPLFGGLIWIFPAVTVLLGWFDGYNKGMDKAYSEVNRILSAIRTEKEL